MRRFVMLTMLLASAACGDPKTNDNRGYTKAPLESPTVLVKGEPVTQMSDLGAPNYPEAPLIEAEESKADTAAAKGGEPAKTGAVPAGATQADVDAGQKLFTSNGNCFSCHGQTAGGTAMAPALNDAKWLNIDGSFAAIQGLVKAGVAQPKEYPAPMPAMGGAALTDQQVKEVAAYVYSISRSAGSAAPEKH